MKLVIWFFCLILAVTITVFLRDLIIANREANEWVIALFFGLLAGDLAIILCAAYDRHS